jgi:glycosyltransferase involved in cell wall biosynthesis
MNTGGPAVFLDHLTNAMGELGVKSTIAYGFCESNETDYTENNIMGAELVKIKALHRTLNPIDDIKAFLHIRHVIKTLKPDVINTHTSKAGVLGRIAVNTIIPKPKVVHTFLGHLIYGYFSKARIWIFISIEKVMAKFTSAAIAVSSETKQSLVSKGVGRKLRWEVIRIGIPLSEPSNNDLSQRSRVKILWVGRFTDIKDPVFAVETMSELSKKMPGNFELTMVGGGELFDEVVKLATNLPINFTGVMKNPFETIQNFDLLMMTSKNEGLPLVILESANCFRATISTNVGGISEFIKDNYSGCLVPRDINLMAEKIIFLANHKVSLYELGLNARRTLESGFSDKQMARLYYDLYCSLIV